MPVDDRLTVLGRANGELVPDRIEWMLVVREDDTDPRAAFARCAQRLRTLAGALTIAELTTGAVTVHAQTDRETRKPTGRHEARAGLTAVAPLDLGGELAAAAMEAGADELKGPHARTPDPEETIEALLAEAVLVARRRAERMADAAGRRLGRVLSVTDHRGDFDEEFDQGEPMSRRSDYGEPGGGAPPVILRPQRLSAAVAVVFELTD